MVVITCAYYVALFSLPLVGYIVLFKDRKKPTHRYNKPEWYFWMKSYLARSKVRKLQDICRKNVQAVSEDVQELPKKLISEKQRDTQIICGADESGNSLFAKIILRQHRIAELLLCFRCSDGTTYQLPNQPQVLLCSLQGRDWKAEGFALSVLEPFRRLRITYNGLLKSSKAKHENAQIEHVKFSFIWNAAERPLYYPQDFSTNLFMEALALEPWRDGDWIDLMGQDKGYEQYGAMRGFFKCASSDEVMLNLPGFRKRYWGAGEYSALRRDFSLFIAAEDGTLANLGAKSYKKGCSQLQYGSTLTNDGNMHAIVQSDVILGYVGEDGAIPNAITLNWKAGNKSFKAVAHLNPETISTTYSDEDKGWTTQTVIGEGHLNGKFGSVIATFWDYRQGRGVEPPEYLLSSEKIIDTQGQLLARFSAREARVTEFAGGKGCSLALLSSLDAPEFVVPQGFVILTSALKLQLKRKEHLRRAVEQLEAISCGKQEGELETECKKVLDIFVCESVCDEVAEVVAKEIEKFAEEATKIGEHASEHRWAVRSSSVNEDSAEYSAAGQNATILGCKTREDILSAISKCWGSLYCFQSVQYRRHHGLPVLSGMAVVIQRMVPSETAGILFTCDPLSGDTSRMIITSNYGLGESVVSGHADPDTIILSKTWNGNVLIHSQTIGAKKSQVIMTDRFEHADGTRTTDTRPDMAQKSSLNAEQLMLLGVIGLKLEKAFGSPRDIEWAFCKNKLYLLQSRPVTALNAWTDFELLYEFDTPVLCKETVCTVANTGEVMPGALTALTTSTVLPAIERGFWKNILNVDLGPIYSLKSLMLVQYHLTLNVLNSLLRFVEAKIGIRIKMLDLAIFGHPVIDEKLHSMAVSRFGSLSAVNRIKVLARNVANAWKNRKHVEEALAISQNFRIPIEENDSALNVLKKIERSLFIVDKLAILHCAASSVSVFYQAFAMNVLAEGDDDLTNEHLFDVSLLLSSCTNVVSAEVPTSLEKIARMISEEEAADEFIKINPEGGRVWLKIKCSRASYELDLLLKNHGHRTLKECELKEDSWGINPSIVIKMIQANCRSEKPPNTSRTLTAEETVDKLTTPHKFATRKILGFLVNKCRASVAAREKTKSEFVRGINVLRLAFRQLADRMVQEGIIPSKDLIHHFSMHEIRVLIKRGDPELLIKAARRQRLFDRWDKIKFPEVMQGLPKALEEVHGPDMLWNDGIVFKGTTVCPGEVVARACVITRLSEIDELQQGDILITYTTDIGWSPYFPMLSAVVTELGGLISHGAVVAREYSLPCIVGVQGATGAFKTGDKVLFSGKTGSIQRISVDSINNAL